MSFNKLPNEIIYSILQHIKLPDLLVMTRTNNQRISKISQQIILERVQKNNYHTRLYFGKEKINFKYKTKTKWNQIIFIPLKSNLIKIHTSKFSKRAILNHISFIGEDGFENNLLNDDIQVDVKYFGLKNKNVFEHVRFEYRVLKAPDNVVKVKSGERWVEPVRFECSFEFLVQNNKRYLGIGSRGSSVRKSIMPILGGLYTSTSFIKTS